MVLTLVLVFTKNNTVQSNTRIQVCLTKLMYLIHSDEKPDLFSIVFEK